MCGGGGEREGRGGGGGGLYSKVRYWMVGRVNSSCSGCYVDTRSCGRSDLLEGPDSHCRLANFFPAG